MPALSSDLQAMKKSMHAVRRLSQSRSIAHVRRRYRWCRCSRILRRRLPALHRSRGGRGSRVGGEVLRGVQVVVLQGGQVVEVLLVVVLRQLPRRLDVPEPLLRHGGGQGRGLDAV